LENTKYFRKLYFINCYNPVIIENYWKMRENNKSPVHTAKNQSKTKQSAENQSFQYFFFSFKLRKIQGFGAILTG
jgi:hypothetical protein